MPKTSVLVSVLIPLIALLSAGPAHAVIKDVGLPLGELGTAQLQISIPDAEIATGRTLPVIFLASGFQTAKQLMATMAPAAGDNIVVVFQYPLDDKSNWMTWTDADKTAALQNLGAVPLQIVGALTWLRSPALSMAFGVKADLHRLNTVAISLGSLFIPAALRLDQMRGGEVNSVIFAYAGADIDKVAQEQIRKQNGDALAQFLGQDLRVILAPFEPSNYVHDIKAQHVLVLNAQDDQIFSPQSQQALMSAISLPKDVISIPGPHIGMGQPERVASSLLILKNWLLSHDSINP